MEVIVYIFKNLRRNFGVSNKNMQNIKSFLKKNNLVTNIRNFLNFYPKLSLFPSFYETSVSDYFFWTTKKEFIYDTKIILMNISSQIFPSHSMEEEIFVFIYDHNGNKLKELLFNLSPFEFEELKFSDYFQEQYGSFFVFHKIEDYSLLKSFNAYISDRTYISYKGKEGIWNFMHGNLNCAYLSKNNKPISIMTKSYFNNYYMPQVSFDNSNQNFFILNNPNEYNLKIEVLEMDKYNKKINNIFKTIPPMGTSVIGLKNPKTKYAELKSKIIFFRPIIFKTYKTSFDIFHG